MITRQADYIRRLNILLKLPRIDLRLLSNGALERLLDDLYWAILGRKNRKPSEDVFHKAADRPGIARAQEGLDRELTSLRYGTEGLQLELAEQTLYIVPTDESFSHFYLSKDFPTMAYAMLSYLLERSQIKPADLLTCSNVKCCTVFAPLRKRRPKEPAYCSVKCANLIAAQRYREAKGEELKSQERTRSSKRYEQKMKKKFSGTKVKRRPRTPK